MSVGMARYAQVGHALRPAHLCRRAKLSSPDASLFDDDIGGIQLPPLGFGD